MADHQRFHLTQRPTVEIEAGMPCNQFESESPSLDLTVHVDRGKDADRENVFIPHIPLKLRASDLGMFEYCLNNKLIVAASAAHKKMPNCLEKCIVVEVQRGSRMSTISSHLLI